MGPAWVGFQGKQVGGSGWTWALGKVPPLPWRVTQIKINDFDCQWVALYFWSIRPYRGGECGVQKN